MWDFWDAVSTQAWVLDRGEGEDEVKMRKNAGLPRVWSKNLPRVEKSLMQDLPGIGDETHLAWVDHDYDYHHQDIHNHHHHHLHNIEDTWWKTSLGAHCGICHIQGSQFLLDSWLLRTSKIVIFSAVSILLSTQMTIIKLALGAI